MPHDNKVFKKKEKILFGTNLVQKEEQSRQQDVLPCLWSTKTIELALQIDKYAIMQWIMKKYLIEHLNQINQGRPSTGL